MLCVQCKEASFFSLYAEFMWICAVLFLFSLSFRFVRFSPVSEFTLIFEWGVIWQVSPGRHGRNVSRKGFVFVVWLCLFLSVLWRWCFVVPCRSCVLNVVCGADHNFISCDKKKSNFRRGVILSFAFPPPAFHPQIVLVWQHEKNVDATVQ